MATNGILRSLFFSFRREAAGALHLLANQLANLTPESPAVAFASIHDQGVARIPQAAMSAIELPFGGQVAFVSRFGESGGIFMVSKGQARLVTSSGDDNGGWPARSRVELPQATDEDIACALLRGRQDSRHPRGPLGRHGADLIGKLEHFMNFLYPSLLGGDGIGEDIGARSQLF